MMLITNNILNWCAVPWPAIDCNTNCIFVVREPYRYAYIGSVACWVGARRCMRQLICKMTRRSGGHLSSSAWRGGHTKSMAPEP